MATPAANPADDAPHLLVVDDDRRIRALLQRFLLGEGYRVSTAESSREARAKLESLNFDLLILDVMMPGENGFDFARAIRTGSAVPILMLTARDEKESRIKGLEIGADDYLAKPFEPRELSLRIASILRRARPPIAQPAESCLLYTSLLWKAPPPSYRHAPVTAAMQLAACMLIAPLRERANP